MIKKLKRTLALLLATASLLTASAEIWSVGKVGGSFDGDKGHPFWYRDVWIEDDCIFGPFETSLGEVWVGGDSSRHRKRGGNWYIWTEDGRSIEKKSTLEGFAHVFGCLEYDGRIYFVGGTWGKDWMVSYNIEKDIYDIILFPEEYPCNMSVKRHYLIREKDGLIYVSNGTGIDRVEWVIFNPETWEWEGAVKLKMYLKEVYSEIKYIEPELFRED